MANVRTALRSRVTGLNVRLASGLGALLLGAVRNHPNHMKVDINVDAPPQGLNVIDDSRLSL